MLSKFFESQSRIKKLCDGPTGHLIESFARVLSEAAYANITARRHLRTAEHFLYWIRRHGIKVHETNEQVLMRFANHFSQCQCPDFGHADQVGVIGGAQLFASHLRDIGIIAAPVRQESDPSVKLETLESVMPPKLRSGRFKATDKLIESLKSLSVMQIKNRSK
jgi:hypothetical protein